MAQEARNVLMTVVYDNIALESELTADWGFSCVVSGTEKTILFDTGTKGPILLSNMDKLGIDPGSIDIVFISHEHSDHAGGLWDFLERNAQVTLVVPALFSHDFKNRARGYGVSLVEIEDQTQVCKGVYTTGQLGSGIIEQSLVVRSADGLVVITGCAHPGIIEILKSAAALSDEKILLVLGGFHLLNHSPDAVKEIIQEFRNIGVERAGACHCTGENTMAIFSREYGEDFISIGAGKRLVFGGAVWE